MNHLVTVASLFLFVWIQESSLSAEYKVILFVPLPPFLRCTNIPFDSLFFKVYMCKQVFVDLNMSVASMLQAVAENVMFVLVT